MEIELCNMCMVTDRSGRVLVQDRLPKPTNPWSGLTFPGGHVEPGVTVVASVIREVREETGLTVSDLRCCGYIQWYNPGKRSNYFVFLFKTSSFSGQLNAARDALRTPGPEYGEISGRVPKRDDPAGIWHIRRHAGVDR